MPDETMYLTTAPVRHRWDYKTPLATGISLSRGTTLPADVEHDGGKAMPHYFNEVTSC